MNLEIKEKWLKALRSGEYKQGNAFLNSNGKFCCLGVLTDIYIKENPDKAKWSSGIDAGTQRVSSVAELTFETERCNQSVAVLLPDISEWAGIDMWRTCLVLVETDTHGSVSLSSLNDGNIAMMSAPLTFEQIADIIESKL